MPYGPSETDAYWAPRPTDRPRAMRPQRPTIDMFAPSKEERDAQMWAMIAKQANSRPRPRMGSKTIDLNLGGIFSNLMAQRAAGKTTGVSSADRYRDAVAGYEDSQQVAREEAKAEAEAAQRRAMDAFRSADDRRADENLARQNAADVARERDRETDNKRMEAWQREAAQDRATGLNFRSQDLELGRQRIKNDRDDEMWNRNYKTANPPNRAQEREPPVDPYAKTVFENSVKQYETPESEDGAALSLHEQNDLKVKASKLRPRSTARTSVVAPGAPAQAAPTGGSEPPARVRTYNPKTRRLE